MIGTGAYELVDGSTIRLPTWGIWSITGQNLENYGVPPDVWVENTPGDEMAGYDRELKAAVDEALRMLAEGTWQYGEDE